MLYRVRAVLLSAICLAVLVIGPRAGGVSAQALDRPWADFTNLSQSGGTSEPRLVMDASGLAYVVWADEYAGMVTVSQTAEGWGPAAAAVLPFDPYPPTLLADPSGIVHAFWLDKTDNLMYSRSRLSAISQGGWTPAATLATGVGSFQVTLTGEKGLHLAYIRTAEPDATADAADRLLVPGVYYLGSANGGESWRPAEQLYASRYLRSLREAQLNIQIDTTPRGESNTLYVAWDDPALKRVYLSVSEDGGANWHAPHVVDGPESNSTAKDPYNLRVLANGENVLLIWQAGLQSGFACTQFYRSSADGGASWSRNQVMLNQLVGCAEDNHLFKTSQGLVLLYSVINHQAYLAAWDGEMWSDLQPQWQLDSFIDPVTLETVNFDCRQPAINAGGQLYVVGCDTIGEKDIWVTWRDLGGMDDWFPPPAAWSKPAVIADNTQPLIQLEALADPAGPLHVIWLQQERVVANTGEQQLRSNIYYQRLDGAAPIDQAKSSGVKILSSPDGYAQNMALAPGRASGTGKIYMVWEGGNSGRVYFSYASLAFAESPFEWSKPLELPLPVGQGETEGLGWAPDLAVDTSGVIYVVYARPVNQGRGIYMVTSQDEGATWSEPRLVFDAEAAGWMMVSMPRLAASAGNGSTSDPRPSVLHLMWTQNTPVGNGRPLGVYYAASTDGGQTWGAASQVVDQPATRLWLLVGQNGEIHRFWSLQELGVANLYQQVSYDGGVTWEPPVNLNYLGETPGPLSLVQSADGAPTIFQLVGDGSGGSSAGQVNLVERLWQERHWLTLEEHSLGQAQLGDYLALAGALGSDGQARLVYQVENPSSTAAGASSAASPIFDLVYLGQTGGAGGRVTPPATGQATPEAGGTPVSEVPAAAATLTPQATSTQALVGTIPTPAVDLSIAPARPWFDTTTGLLIAALQAALVIGAGYMIIRQRRRSGK